MYLIVLDDVCQDYVWDDLRQVLPDCRNGSRVLITVTDLNATRFENKKIIQFDSLSTGGLLIRSRNENWASFILYFERKSLDKHRMEMVELPLEFLFLSSLRVTFSLQSMLLLFVYLPCRLCDIHKKI